MSRAELDRVFNNTAMKKRCASLSPFLIRMVVIYADSSRTHRFAILAMSLSSLFDITQPTDFLRSALNMLTEYEQAKEDSDRPKMVAQRPPFLPVFFFVDLAVLLPLASLETTAKTAHGRRGLSCGYARYIRHLPHHPAHGKYIGPLLPAYIAVADVSEKIKHPALPAGLHPDTPLSPRHPLRVLRQTREAPRPLALSARLTAHAWALAPPGRVIPLPEPGSDECRG